MPTNIEILLHAKPEDVEKLGLLAKPTRTISGVAVIAVMAYPFACKHGKCLMCPGGPASIFGDVPQSYTGREPATLRAIRNKFDPYMQIFNRLEHYVVMGHSPEKVELIVMGGTFPSFDWRYQKRFIAFCYKAMNDFSHLFFKKDRFDFIRFKEFFLLPGSVGDKERIKRISAKVRRLKGKSDLLKEQIKNERSKIRCVGLTIETRPDFAKLKHANRMLLLGCTRVELGVQSVYDRALKAIKRGHSVKDSIKAMRVLKDLGFKINAHYMIGLPSVSAKDDIAGLRELFSNPDFRPDMLKIYPCLVVEGTELYQLWKKGKYRPLSVEDAAKIIIEFKRIVPEYVRIMRVQRDIPDFMISAGPKLTNLRQYIQEKMKKLGLKCKCIRCREIGRSGLKKIGKLDYKILSYEASKGSEFFISAEYKDWIVGFCRMRFPSQCLRKEITERSALIRELHVYGTAIPIGKTANSDRLAIQVQHRGVGKRLMSIAEQLAKENGKNKMVVISGIGVR
ncbi:MAG TPA: tRNA uridine(34) 5-carboxymethylaminomethyl modification radical SAM/GNAT enzyme Elp3, partial [Candidatus Woesearchaeota archaeon]|nr:tRNA uridine(34) 5-carboxymethylaminomethyl modification radical SAM/GNAT enzyme Elp3 [Candidatus Woesearchaeota archaeon]